MGRDSKADYDRHYREYQGTPEQIQKRAMRNAARAKMKKEHGSAALRGKDVDHKKDLRRGGGNSLNNLRIRSVRANRGDTR
jgi:5-methylcytosine-specific restriction endonuclease McrA